MQLKRWFLLLFLTMGLRGISPAFAQETVKADQLEETADEVIQRVEELRGLKFVAPVRKGVKTREEISSYLNEQIQEEYNREALEKEGRLLTKLGLIPSTIDYREYILKLLAEQVGGYYDQEKKILYIASWLPIEQQRSVLVHELTHALQDQHFDIEKIIDEDRAMQNDDRAMAHQALLEGDGVVVMLQDLLSPYKRHFSELPDLAFVMQAMMPTMQDQFSVLSDAPMYLQQILLYPYSYGASFLQKAWKDNPGWESINKIYSDLPVSTEQIIHPEKYFGVRDDPEPISALDPADRLGSDWKVVYQNVLGEFSLSLLLNLHLTEEHSRKSVSGWGGDQVMYLENGAGGDAAFVNTVWDTEEVAEKFFLAMDEWFQKRFPDTDRKNETSTSFSLVEDREFYEIVREGRSIYLVFGLPETYSRRWSGN
jgi:hypothetical protein